MLEAFSVEPEQAMAIAAHTQNNYLSLPVNMHIRAPYRKIESMQMSGPATHMTMSVFNKNHRFIARVLCGGFLFSVKCVCTVRVFLLHLDYHLGPVCVFGGVRILHTYFP